MSKYLSNRLEADERITIHYETEVTSLNGDEVLCNIDVTSNGESHTIDAPILLIMVGAAPNTDWLSGFAKLDDKGFVMCGDSVGADTPYATSHPGIYAVGDVRSGSVKRVASAVGEGSVVISQIWKYLDSASNPEQ
jgi:thioredoxin reductase (NADPH)